MSGNSLIIKNSGILYARLIITSITGLFSSRYILQSLGAADFGLYNVVCGIVVMMNLLNVVMISTSFRYITVEIGKGELDKVNSVFNICLVIHLSLAAMVVFLGETIGVYYIRHYLNVAAERIPDAIFVFRFSLVATVVTIIGTPFQGLIIAKEQFSIPAIIEIIASFIKLIIAFILIGYCGNRIRLYSELMTFVIVLAPLVFMYYGHKKYSNVVAWNFQSDKKKYKELLGFTGWIMLGATSSIGKIQGTALIINSIFGTLLNAAYGIANQVNTMVMMLAQNLGQAAVPQIMKSYSAGNTDRSIQMIFSVSKFTFYLILIPALPLFLETEYILKMWLGNVPRYTAVLCQLMIVIGMVEGLSTGISAIILATGQIKSFIMVTSTISLISLPLAYVLFLYSYPPHYILITYVFTGIINTILCQVLLIKIIHYDVRRNLKKLYSRIAYVVVLVAPLFYLRNIMEEGTSRFIVLSLISLPWSVAVVYHVGIERNERAIVVSTVHQIFERHSA